MARNMSTSVRSIGVVFPEGGKMTTSSPEWINANTDLDPSGPMDNQLTPFLFLPRFLPGSHQSPLRAPLPLWECEEADWGYELEAGPLLQAPRH